MADNTVFISGVADGAFQEALGDLPPWATEDTALSIEQHLRKSLGIQTKLLSEAIKCCKGKGGGAGTIAADEIKKVNDELGKMLRNVKKQNEEETKAQKRRKLREKDEEGELQQGKKQNTANAKLLQVLGALGAVGTKVLGVNKEYIDVYDSLYKSGINVLNGNNSTADGFESLNQLVNQTGLRLQTLQAVAEKYTSTINAVGMSKFGKSIAMSTTRMNELGFSSEESAELIASMMEAEQGYSDIRNKSASQFSAGAIKLADQFGKLSLATGISRQQLLDNMKTSARSADSTLVVAKWGEQAAKNVTAATAGIKDANLRGMIEKMAAASDPVFTQLYKDLNAAGLGDFANQLGNLAKDIRSTGDPMEVQNRLESIMEGLSPARIAPLTDQIAAGNAAAQTSAEVITALLQQTRNLSKATESQVGAATTTEASVANLQTQVESLSASAQKIFSPLVGQVNAVADALKVANTAIGSIPEYADKFADILNTKLFPSIIKVAESLGILDEAAKHRIKVTGAELLSWANAALSIIGLGAAALTAAGGLRLLFGLFRKGPGVTSGFFSGMGKMITGAAKMIGSVLKGSVSAIAKVFTFSSKIVLASLTGVGKMFTWFSGLLRTAGPAVGKAILTAGKSVGSFLMNAGTWIADVSKSVMSRAANFIGNVASWAGNALKGAGSWISQTAKSAFGSVMKLISSAGSWISTALRGAGTSVIAGLKGAGEWVMTAFKGMFSGVSGFIGDIFSKIGGVIGEALPMLSKIGGFALKFAGVLGALYTAFEIGYTIGTMIKGVLDQFDIVTIAFEKIFYGLDMLISKIPGSIGADARHRINLREETERALVNAPTTKKPTEVSAPKAPMASTVISPSAVSTTSDALPISVPSKSIEPADAGSTGIEKPVNTTDINNLLGYQSSILEQLLMSSNNLVSVNQDILRAVRTQ